MNQSPIYVFDLADAATVNEFYRSVIYTSKLQMTLMTLQPKDDIPMESHPDTDQIIIVWNGMGVVNTPELIFPLYPGSAVIIPPGTLHHIQNVGEDLLQISSIYSRPLHRDNAREIKDPKTQEPRPV